jgi:hypothetical protein
VELRFQSKKPISFTTNLEFYDDLDKVYTIPISGTADNCTFSNFAYIQRFHEELEFVAEESKPIMVELA